MSLNVVRVEIEDKYGTKIYKGKQIELFKFLDDVFNLIEHKGDYRTSRTKKILKHGIQRAFYGKKYADKNTPLY